ncbi:hypothetical protein Glove_200g20 [Diversispora epigaea]|uniref:Uncharacterized protein n=1 Tax=Diversispora epigaea TaxID=1348612 RepID=A0A397IJZ7_9GLOM|nr:hypothetical protein Glove_200g20 [Diversispora epigaea]
MCIFNQRINLGGQKILGFNPDKGELYSQQVILATTCWSRPDKGEVDIKNVSTIWNNGMCTILGDITNVDESKNRSFVFSSLSQTVMNKKRSISINAQSNKKQCIAEDYFFSNIKIILQTDKTVDILKVLKSAVHIFDQNTIALSFTHAYKSSNHLWVDFKQNAKVFRESVYNGEMYRILHNWLVKMHGFEVIGQWHIKKVGSDRDCYHSYYDLVIKKSNIIQPLAILELLATASSLKLDIHFEQILKYTERFNSLGV